MGDVADVTSSVPLPEEVVYTQPVEDAEQAREVEEQQGEPEEQAIENNENTQNQPPEDIGRNVDVKV